MLCVKSYTLDDMRRLTALRPPVKRRPSREVEWDRLRQRYRRPGQQLLNLIAHVQSTGNQGTGSLASLAKAYGSSPSNGNLLVCTVVGFQAAGAPTFVISDTQTNTWASAGRSVDATGHMVTEVFFAKNCTGGADTVTVTPSVNSVLTMAISEYSGADTVSPNGSSSQATGSGTSPTVAYGSIVLANSLAYGAIGVLNGGADTITVGAGFTERFNGGASAANLGVEVEDQIVSSNGSATWTLSVGLTWCAVGTNFKPPGAASLGPYGWDLTFPDRPDQRSIVTAV
jgi:hypothetical protein